MKIQKLDKGEYMLTVPEKAFIIFLDEDDDGDNLDEFVKQCDTLCKKECTVHYGGEDDDGNFWIGLAPIYPEYPTREDLHYGAEFLTDEAKNFYKNNGGSNGFLLQDGSIIHMVYHREIRGFTSYLLDTYNIRTEKWMAAHSWINEPFSDSKWFEDTANAIRIGYPNKDFNIEMLSTHEPTAKQWAAIKDLCIAHKTVRFDIADIRHKASKTDHAVYGHKVYTKQFSEIERPQTIVAQMKRMLETVKNTSPQKIAEITEI